MVGVANAQLDESQVPQNQFDGRCPEMKNSIGVKGQKIDVQRLMGLWKTLYESRARTQKSDCVSMKI